MLQVGHMFAIWVCPDCLGEFNESAGPEVRCFVYHRTEGEWVDSIKSPELKVAEESAQGPS